MDGSIWEKLMSLFGSSGAAMGSAPGADPAAEVRADVAADPTGQGTPPQAVKPSPGYDWAKIATQTDKLGQQIGGMNAPAAPSSMGVDGGQAQAHRGQPINLVDSVFGIDDLRKKKLAQQNGGY